MSTTLDTGPHTVTIYLEETVTDMVFLEDSYGCELFPVDTYVEGRMTY